MQDDRDDAETRETARHYWRANLRLLGGLLLIWFAVSFGAGILFRDFLDQFSIAGYPLGFWFAQQGSIYAFILLILFYNWRVHRIERRYGLDDDDGDSDSDPNGPHAEGQG